MCSPAIEKNACSRAFSATIRQVRGAKPSKGHQTYGIDGALRGSRFRRHTPEATPGLDGLYVDAWEDIARPELDLTGDVLERAIPTAWDRFPLRAQLVR